MNNQDYNRDYISQPVLYFDKSLPVIDAMSKRELQSEFTHIRRSIKDKNKFMFITRRCLQNSKYKNKFQDVGLNSFCPILLEFI